MSANVRSGIQTSTHGTWRNQDDEVGQRLLLSPVGPAEFTEDNSEAFGGKFYILFANRA